MPLPPPPAVYLRPHLQLDQHPLEAALGALRTHARLPSQPDRVQRPVLQQRLIDRLGLGSQPAAGIFLEVIIEGIVVLRNLRP